jgi:hypothetical protein
VEWIHLAQDRDQVADFCEHSNELFGFHKRQEIILLAELLLATHEGLCSVKLVA